MCQAAFGIYRQRLNNQKSLLHDSIIFIANAQAKYGVTALQQAVLHVPWQRSRSLALLQYWCTWSKELVHFDNIELDSNGGRCQTDGCSTQLVHYGTKKPLKKSHTLNGQSRNKRHTTTWFCRDIWAQNPFSLLMCYRMIPSSWTVGPRQTE